jgi:hypothetical protein
LAATIEVAPLEAPTTTGGYGGLEGGDQHMTSIPQVWMTGIITLEAACSTLPSQRDCRGVASRYSGSHRIRSTPFHASKWMISAHFNSAHAMLMFHTHIGNCARRVSDCHEPPTPCPLNFLVVLFSTRERVHPSSSNTARDNNTQKHAKERTIRGTECHLTQ